MELEYGNGSGYGSGYGYGDGYGDGSGYEVQIPQEKAWVACHFIKQKNGQLILRNGKIVTINQPVHEDKIEMCQRGLHAGLTPDDASQYRPESSVLTKVKVWGKIIVGQDKLVATDRMIIEIVGEQNDRNNSNS